MDIGPESLLPFLMRYVADVLERGMVRRVIDENIDPAEMVDRLLDDLAAVLGVFQIAGHQHSLAAFLLDEFLDLIRLFGLVEKGDQNIASLARIRDRDCPAYAAVSAGDDGFHSLELARALVRSIAMIGSGLHRIRRSRHRLLLGREWRFGIVD